jgi:hypothetical protein
MARRAFPISEDVPQDALERRPARRARSPEGIEHVAYQRDDGCRRDQCNVCIRNLGCARNVDDGSGTRTDLHIGCE